MASKSEIILSVQEYEVEPTAFSLPPSVWDHYIDYRPSYPNSMWNTWLDYHRGPLDTAHEVGTGCGIGAANLMDAAKARRQPIKRVILSDPAESNILTTRDLLQRSNQFSDTTFKFYQNAGEESFLQPGSVDMVIACECLHWMDIRKAITSIYASLRPGGTFAGVHYAVPTLRITDNEKATEALRRLVETQRTKQSTSTAFNNRSAELPQLGMGLNFVPLDKSLWEDVIRTWFNVPDGETSLPSWSIRVGTPQAPSMIDAETERFRWVQDQDGWGMRNCTVDHIKGMLATTYYSDEKIFEEPAWKEFEDAATQKGDSFQVTYFATTFTARKKA